MTRLAVFNAFSVNLAISLDVNTVVWDKYTNVSENSAARTFRSEY
jgi:hypothetical protein